MNKPKRQGTREETAVVNIARDRGLKSDRLAEGGVNDHGDVRITAHTDPEVVFDIEVKATERLSLHRVLARQTDKADLGHVPAVVWNRRIPSREDSVRRTSQGRTVTLWFDDLLWLLSLLNQEET